MIRKLWTVPMVTLGEFDALEGPKAMSVLEYYAYQENDAFGPQFLDFSSVYGKVLISSRVVSGSLRPDLKERMNAIVARVFASNELNEESVIMLDPMAGGIASVSFSLEDILARGEKRRFCVILTHPQSSELVRQWPLIFSFIKVLLEEWVTVAKKRLSLEYSTFPDLERHREEARKSPMRSLMFLVAENTETEENTLKRVHTFFDCALPAVFGFEPLKIDGLSSEIFLLGAVKRYLKVNIPLVNVFDIDLESSLSDEKYLSMGGGRVLSIGRPPIIKPLSVWLLQFIQGNINGQQEIELILKALFTGNQILICGRNSFQCANMAFSLSQILPRSLRCVTVFSEEYVMPYESRILSFSQNICERGYIDNNLSPKDGLSGLNLVCVKVSSEGNMDSVSECNDLIHVFIDLNYNSPIKMEKNLVPQIVTKIMDLLCSQISAGLTAKKCKVLQSQIECLVNKYVMRGRIYSKLFQQYQVECNRGILGVNQKKDSNDSSFANPGRAVQSMFFDNFLSKRRSDSLTSSARKTGQMTKSNIPSFLKYLKSNHFGSWATSTADHEVMLFLGSVSNSL
ncbi:Folliculin/SMCR8 [Trypanosoma melophagium]|uniref:Folliculin/SMCR8 n=1 Tax=Trypanosoma melophagium TaxID=715481 RepID=UPI00351A63A7|nr:Folliculin/SMCR8 [Trypanosoma melophagium]